MNSEVVYAKKQSRKRAGFEDVLLYLKQHWHSLDYLFDHQKCAKYEHYFNRNTY